MQIDNLATIVGILGAYFAVIFVLSVSVETLIEPVSAIPWLRKKPNPDDILNEIKEWLPAGSEGDVKALAIQNLTTTVKATEEEVMKNVQDLKQIADQTLEALGPNSKVTQVQKDLALKFAGLRRQYTLSEKRRITILRIISALVGMFIAWELQIDTFDILGELFPENVREILTEPNLQVGGTLITGLAASAGSSFWHDMLSRARNLKDTVQGVSQIQMVQKN